MKKRIISVLLTLAMVLTLLPASVSAAEAEEPTEAVGGTAAEGTPEGGVTEGEAVPATPVIANLTATAYAAQVVLKWDIDPSVYCYTVWHGETLVDSIYYKEYGYRDCSYIGGSEWGYPIEMGTTYTFQVRAMDETDSTLGSAEITVTTAKFAVEMTDPAADSAFVIGQELPDNEISVTAELTVEPEEYNVWESGSAELYWKKAGDAAATNGGSLQWKGTTLTGSWQIAPDGKYLAAGEYQLWVEVSDGRGAVAASEPVTVTLAESAPDDADTTAPSAPGKPVVRSATATSITLEWAPSADNVGVAAYRLYRSDDYKDLEGDLTKLTPIAVGCLDCCYEDTGLIAGDGWFYVVVAVDAAGNVSERSYRPYLAAPTLSFNEVPVLAKSYIIDEYDQSGKYKELELCVIPAIPEGIGVNVYLDYRLAGTLGSWDELALGANGDGIWSGCWRFRESSGQKNYLAAGAYEVRFRVQGAFSSTTVGYSETQTVELKRESLPPVIVSTYPDETCGTFSGRGEYMLTLEATATDLAMDPDETFPDGIPGKIDHAVFWYAPITEDEAEDDFILIGEADSYSSYSSASVRLNWDGSEGQLDPGKLTSGTYRWKVVVYDAAGNASKPAYSTLILDNDGPDEPHGEVTATGTLETITVTWARPENLSDDVYGITLYRSEQENEGFEELCRYSASSSLAYEDDDVEGGKIYYYYWVYRDKLGNEGRCSEIVSAAALTDEEAPKFTTGIQARSSTAYDWYDLADGDVLCKQVQLAVTATDNDWLETATFRCRKAGTQDEWTLIGSNRMYYGEYTSKLSWYLEDTDLDGSYELSVQVTDATGNTAEQCVTVTVRPYSPPVAPVATGEAGYREAALRWTYDGDVDNLRHFLVYSYWGGLKDCIAAVPAGKTGSYTVPLDSEEEQYFVIVAVDIYGETAWSRNNIVAVKSKGELVAPTAVILPEKLTAAAGLPFTFSGVNSTDESGIEAYVWDFGDGETGEGVLCRHTYGQAGTYTVTLTATDNCGNKGKTTADITVYDIGETGTHSMVAVTVVNGYEEGTPAVPGAEVTVLDGEGNVLGAGTADESGKVTLLLPAGVWTVSVLADGYMPANRTLTVQTGDAGSSDMTVGIAKVGTPLVTGGLNAQPMTKEEMRWAGIDLNHPDNQHVWEFSVTLEFMATPTVPFKEDLKWFINQAGSVVGTPSEESGGGWHTVEDKSGGAGGITGKKYNIGIFPVSEHFVMIIYGEAHWLKEMYRVELVVINNSYTEALTDCAATLKLPEGLSLANMLSRQQDETIVLGTIGAKAGADSPANTGMATWYVRGDKAGSYTVTATATGYIGSETTPFVYTYTSNPIHVYAGSALHLTIEAEDMAYFGEDYTVKFILENVSDKELYNLSFGLTGLEQFSVKTVNGMEQPPQSLGESDFSGGKTLSLPTMKPGQAIEITVTATCLFFDKEMEMLVHLMDLGPLEVGYALTNIFVTTLEGSTTEIPTSFRIKRVQRTTFFEYVLDQFKDKVEGAVEDFFVDKVAGEVVEKVPFLGTGISAAEKAHEYKTVMDEGMQTDITINVTNGTFANAGAGRSRSVSAIVVTVEPETGTVTYSEDGTTATLTGSGKVYVRGQADGEAAMTVTTCVIRDGTKQYNTYKAAYQVGDEAALGAASEVRLGEPEQSHVLIPLSGRTAEIDIPHAVCYGEKNWLMGTGTWTVTDEAGNPAVGISAKGGVVTVTDRAAPGTYTVALSVDGLEEQSTTVTLRAESRFAGLTLQAGEGGWTLSGTLKELEETVSVVCALYDKNGRMLDVFVQTIAADAAERMLGGTLTGDDGDYVRVYLLDTANVPLAWPEEPELTT